MDDDDDDDDDDDVFFCVFLNQSLCLLVRFLVGFSLFYGVPDHS